MPARNERRNHAAFGGVTSNRNEAVRADAVGCCDAFCAALGAECVAFCVALGARTSPPVDRGVIGSVGCHRLRTRLPSPRSTWVSGQLGCTVLLHELDLPSTSDRQWSRVDTMDKSGRGGLAQPQTPSC